jgi:signal transduction histidine kinase
LQDNAKKAGASSISITVWRTGRSTVIDIADNGPRLDDKARATLFKPFEGGRRGGTGLGLSIARNIAFAHNGDLRLSRTSKMARNSGFVCRIMWLRPPPRIAGGLANDE